MHVFKQLFTFLMRAVPLASLLKRGAQKLTGENLKVVWPEFSTLG
jgi:hypothetical protein